MTKRTNNEVLDDYGNMVYRLAFSRATVKADADDIFQEVFLRFVEAVNHGTEWESDEHIKAWLLHVTVNCSKNTNDAFRRRTVELSEDITYNDKVPYELIDTVEALPQKYRTVIYLFYYEDLQTQKIAEIMKTKETTVRVWLNRARKLLKQKLGGENYEDL